MDKYFSVIRHIKKTVLLQLIDLHKLDISKDLLIEFHQDFFKTNLKLSKGISRYLNELIFGPRYLNRLEVDSNKSLDSPDLNKQLCLTCLR